MGWLGIDGGGSAVTRGRAVALARAETPLFLAVLGLLMVLWLGAVVAFVCGPLGGGLHSSVTAERPNIMVCENLTDRAPGELLRCLVTVVKFRAIDI